LFQDVRLHGKVVARSAVIPATDDLNQPENGSKRQRDLSGQLLLLRVLKAGILTNIAIRHQEFHAATARLHIRGGLSCATERLAVRVEKKGPASSALRVQIRVAG